jgi:hypothetical protein
MAAPCVARPREEWCESPATKPEGVDAAEMAHEEWQTIVENRRAVFAGERDKVTQPSRVCSYDQGEAGRKESWQAVRRATKTHSPEDREV